MVGYESANSKFLLFIHSLRIVMAVLLISLAGFYLTRIYDQFQNHAVCAVLVKVLLQKS